MALFNKVGTFGSILKQSVSQTSVRYISTKLFVVGLSYKTDYQSLRDAFSKFGEVDDAKVVYDKLTGISRGFGFVDFADSKSANSAMNAMDGQSLQDLQGSTIRVKIATEKRSSRHGGHYGGGGY